MISLTVSATLPPTPVHLSGSRGAKLPCLSAVSTSSSLVSSPRSVGCCFCLFAGAGGSGIPRDRCDGALDPAAAGPLESPLSLMSPRSPARPARTRPGVLHRTALRRAERTSIPNPVGTFGAPTHHPHHPTTRLILPARRPLPLSSLPASSLPSGPWTSRLPGSPP